MMYFNASGEMTSYKEYLSEDGMPVDEIFADHAQQAQTDAPAEEQSEVLYEDSYSEDAAEAYTDDGVVYDDYDQTAYVAEEEAYVEDGETVYEETYEEVAEDGDLDWSVPAGLSVEDEVAYEDDGVVYEDEVVYEDDNVIYEEEQAVYADDQAYEEGEVYYEGEEAYEGEEVYEESYEEAYEETEDAPVEAEAPQMPKLNPDVALVDVGVLDENFQDGDVIDLETLKDRGLVMSGAKILKIYKSGELTKSLTVVADHFTMDAIFAIDGAGGNIQMIKK